MNTPNNNGEVPACLFTSSESDPDIEYITTQKHDEEAQREVIRNSTEWELLPSVGTWLYARPRADIIPTSSPAHFIIYAEGEVYDMIKGGDHEYSPSGDIVLTLLPESRSASEYDSISRSISMSNQNTTMTS